MKNLIFLLSVIITTSLNAQLLSMDSYEAKSETETTAEFGVKTEIEYGYILKHDYMKWTSYDLGDVISECERILSENGRDIMSPDYDESSIMLTKDNFYDPYLSSMIISGNSIRKAWMIDNGDDSFFALTMIAGFSGIELLVVKINK